MSMSIVSKWTIGAMASKKASASSPVSSRDRLGERRRGQRAGGDDRLVPVGRRQAGDFLAHDGDQRMGLERRGDGRRKSRRGRRRARRRPAPGWRRPQAMISEPASRISACSRPTALVVGVVGAEGVGADQFGQAVGLVRLGAAHGAHLVQDDGHAGLCRLPGGFRAGEAAADDVDGLVVHSGSQ